MTDKADKPIRFTSLAVTTAMASALLSGCATTPAPRADLSAAQAHQAMAEGRTDRAVRLAEQAVVAAPHEAAYRATLGKAYLDAGRFASAETAFNDAMTLGDNSPRTALSLALTLTAQAKYADAAALLNDWEGQIATADLGLALALAGQPERGIHLMSNAIRAGDNTVKMRQNLAYAYAVAGRWREARLMASQDVPADQVGARMEQWAEMAAPTAYEQRVARLLGTPSGVQDMGQPVHLALANTPSVPQLVAEASAQAAAPAPMAAADGGLAVAASAGELPAVGRPAAAAEMAAAPMPAAPAPRQASDFVQAFAPAAAPAPVMQDASRFASAPVVQPVAAPAPASARAAGAAAPAPRAASAAQATRSVARAADGSHLIQLGSFASEQGARRAWNIYLARYPELSGHEMVITEAVVRGKRYYRVSAGGFDRTASRAMCSSVNSRGGDGCISWAAASPLPGAVPARADTGVRLARR